MEIAFITAQILGILQTICGTLSVQFKKRQQIILFMIIGGVLILAVQLLLARYLASVLIIICTVFSLVAYLYGQKNKKIPKWLAGAFAIGIVVASIVMWQDWFDIFALAAQLAFIVQMMMKKEQNLRVMVVVNVSCWIAYNLSVGAYTSIIGNLIMITSTIIALIRYRKVKNVKIKNN